MAFSSEKCFPRNYADYTYEKAEESGGRKGGRGCRGVRERVEERTGREEKERKQAYVPSLFLL